MCSQTSPSFQSLLPDESRISPASILRLIRRKKALELKIRKCSRLGQPILFRNQVIHLSSPLRGKLLANHSKERLTQRQSEDRKARQVSCWKEGSKQVESNYLID